MGIAPPLIQERNAPARSDTISRDEISREQIVELIKFGVEQFGGKCNPRETKLDGNPSCIYKKNRPEEHENAWCIIGYVAMRLGWELHTPYNIQGASNMARQNGWPVSSETANWMDHMQCVFDGVAWAGRDMNSRRSWREASTICEELNWNP